MGVWRGHSRNLGSIFSPSTSLLVLADPFAEALLGVGLVVILEREVGVVGRLPFTNHGSIEGQPPEMTEWKAKGKVLDRVQLGYRVGVLNVERFC